MFLVPPSIYCIVTNASSYSSIDIEESNEEEKSVHILTATTGENENSIDDNSSLLIVSSLSVTNHSPISITKPVHLYLILKQNNQSINWDFQEVMIESNARNIEVYATINKDDEKEEYWTTVRGNQTMMDDDIDNEDKSKTKQEFFTTTISPVEVSSSSSTNSHDEHNSIRIYCIHLKLLSLRPPTNQSTCLIRKLQVRWRNKNNNRGIQQSVPHSILENNVTVTPHEASITEKHDNSIVSSTSSSSSSKVDEYQNSESSLNLLNVIIQSLQSMLEIQSQKNVVMNQSVIEMSQQIKNMQVTMMMSQQELHHRLARIENKLDSIILQKSVLLSNNNNNNNNNNTSLSIHQGHNEEKEVLLCTKEQTKNEENQIYNNLK